MDIAEFLASSAASLSVAVAAGGLAAGLRRLLNRDSSGASASDVELISHFVEDLDAGTIKVELLSEGPAPEHRSPGSVGQPSVGGDMTSGPVSASQAAVIAADTAGVADPSPVQSSQPVSPVKVVVTPAQTDVGAHGASELDERELSAALVRIEKQLTQPETFWRKHGGPILVGGLVLIGTVFTPIWGTLTEAESAPDCIAYASMLSALRTSHPSADGAVLFGDDGLSFDIAETECGDPEVFFEGLASSGGPEGPNGGD